MKCQRQLSEENKKLIINLLSAESGLRFVKVKRVFFVIYLNGIMNLRAVSNA